MSESEPSLLIRVNEMVGIVQENQGGEGCYMELLRVIRQKANLWTMYNFTFPNGAYETAMNGLLEILQGLPNLQSTGILKTAVEKIESLAPSCK